MRRQTLNARFAAVLAAALILLAALAGLGAPWVGAVLAQPEPTPTAEPIATPRTSACTVRVSKIASPSEVELGATVQITLTARPDCPADPVTLHLMLLLDGSSSMAGDPTRQMKDAAKKMVERLDLEGNPSMRVGVVEINLPSQLLCAPRPGTAAVKACLSQLGAFGGTDIAGAMDLGLQALLASRAQVADPSRLRQAMLVVTDGSNNAGCSPVLQKALSVKREGILLINACLGSSCDTQCLRNAATSARYFFEVDDAMSLFAVFERVRKDLLRITLQQISVNDHLPQNMEYVPDSAEPQAEVSPAGDQLTWTQNFVPADGLTMTFKVRPQEAGDHPTNTDAVAAFVDNGGAMGIIAFPVPTVLVRAVPGAQTPTALPPAPEARAEIGVSSRQLAPGDRSRAVYHLDFDPPELPARSHIALVADASGSMAGESNLKMKDAMATMVERIATQADPETRTAVIEFSSDARTLCPLTGDMAALRDCISLIPAAGGTAIDLGIALGHSELRAGRPSPGHEDMVVFTDGGNNTGCSPVLVRAREVKADGVVIHTICLGDGCDAACMQQVASTPGDFYPVQAAGDLLATYDKIADRILADRRVAGVDLRLALPEHLRLLPGSLSPPALETEDRAARWAMRTLPRDGVTVSFEVEAARNGNTGFGLTADIAFARFAPMTFTSQSDPLSASGFPTDTPAATPATETPPPTPDSTPPSPNPTPIPTATSKIDDVLRGTRIYLPLNLREHCTSDSVNSDVALVLDTSISMGEQAVGGGTKLEAAVAAAEALLGSLRLPGDRLALVSFDQSAQLLVPLTGDASALRSALGGLVLGSRTAIDQGLRVGREALSGPDRRSDARHVILLLTDGRSTTSPFDAIEEADLAKTGGIEIIAVGLGGEVDAPMLAAIASSPAHFYAAAGRAQVVAVFGSIARRGACADATWGGR
jgi:Mg-chelatase subunit ChlD